MAEVQERLNPGSPRSLRLFGRFAVLACVACIASCSTYVWTIASTPQPQPSLLAGFQNLGLQPAQTQELTARLVAHFPIGSREADLVRELWLEGFKPATDLSAHERKAVFGTDRHQFNVCVTDWVVAWSADDAGRLAAITGGAGGACL